MAAKENWRLGKVNPKHIRIRMDRDSGELWLTEEKFQQPVRRVKIITGDVLLALSAEIVAVDGTKQAVREVKFSDGARIRLTVEDLSFEPEEKDPLVLEQSEETVAPR